MTGPNPTIDVRLHGHIEVLQAVLGNYLDHLTRSWHHHGDTVDNIGAVLAAVGRPIEVPDDLGKRVQRAIDRLASIEAGPLARLADRLGLSFGEELIVASVWWTDLDAQLGSVFGVLHDDGHRRVPSAGLLHLVCAPFGIDVPVEPRRLVSEGVIVADGPRTALQLTPAARELLQGAWDEPAMTSGTRTGLLTEPLPTRLANLIEPLARLLDGATPRIAVRGVPGSGRRAIAAAALAEHRVAPLGPERRDDELALLTRLGIGVPVVDVARATDLAGRPAPGPAAPVMVIAEPDDDLSSAAVAYVVDVPLPTRAERCELWTTALAELGVANDRDGGLAGDLAERFRFTERDIANTVVRARLATEIAGRALAPTDVWKAAQRQPDLDLARVATRIEPVFTFDDLVLTDDAADRLHELVAHMRHRTTVLDRWGFRARLPRGHGIAALFSGPPGTGKTTAAEAIANELATELFRIDLSRVVSKYIGETEKNLAIAFREAERSGALLLFDEADALFGKRTEVRDAHDRYANLEVSYLLQRVESFSGLVILSTNKLGNIDEAFQRRLRFVVRFDPPGPALRVELWRRSFPAGAVLDELDWERLATHELTGGHIQSAALGAAFLAVNDGGVVDDHHLDRAIAREYQKLNRAAPLHDGLTGARR
jgi:AAA+ superfamily predicted ATPase